MIWFWLTIATPFVVGILGYLLSSLLVGVCKMNDYWNMYYE